MCKECELAGINSEFQELFHEHHTLTAGLPLENNGTSVLKEEIDALLNETTSVEKNENALTDQIFYTRYPELKSKKLTSAHPKFASLKKEWIDIRNNIVRKAATKRSAGVSSPVAGATSTLAKAAADVARQEWARWGYGKREEREPDMQRVILEYWKDGVGYPPEKIEYPWSAAFISWVMKKAGAGNNFKYDPFHTTYVYNAIHSPNALVRAYPVNSRPPQVGDIVVRNRGTSTFTFNNVQSKKGGTHGDVVVNVRPGAIDVIGGNKSNKTSGVNGVTVNQATIRTDAKGLITNPAYFAIVALS